MWRERRGTRAKVREETKTEGDQGGEARTLKITGLLEASPGSAKREIRLKLAKEDFKVTFQFYDTF